MVKMLICDKKGTVFVEAILKFLLAALIIITAIHLFDVAVKYNNVSYTAKSISKIIELEGALTSTATQQLADLNASFGMDMNFVISDVTWFSPMAQSIQFRDTFTVTVDFVYKFPVFDPIFAEAPVMVNIPMSADVTGMSEVYWKP
jgi:hypothetical protein